MGLVPVTGLVLLIFLCALLPIFLHFVLCFKMAQTDRELFGGGCRRNATVSIYLLTLAQKQAMIAIDCCLYKQYESNLFFHLFTGNYKESLACFPLRLSLCVSLRETCMFIKLLIRSTQDSCVFSCFILLDLVLYFIFSIIFAKMREEF